MDDLIQALLIIKKYVGDVTNPFHCEHDVLTIGKLNPDDMTVADLRRVEALGFFVNEDEECLQSFRFGSC